MGAAQPAITSACGSFSNHWEERMSMTRRIQELEAENFRLGADRSAIQDAERRKNAAAGEKTPTGSRTPLFKMVQSMGGRRSPVHGVSCQRGGRGWAATACWDGSLRLFLPGKLQATKTFRDYKLPSGRTGKMGGLYSAEFAATASPECVLLGCTSADNSFYIWDVDSEQPVFIGEEHKDEVNNIAFHPLQTMVCTGSDDATVLITDYTAGSTLRRLGCQKGVYAVSFLGEAREFLIAAGSTDNLVRVFDMRQRRALISTLSRHTGGIVGLDYNASAKALMSSGDDGNICFWDERSWNLKQVVNTHIGRRLKRNQVKRVAFSPDGSMVAAACSAGVAVVYDIKSWPPVHLAELSGHEQCVFDVAWGYRREQRARTLVTGSHDGFGYVWHMR